MIQEARPPSKGPLRLLVDATIVRGPFTGVATYTRNVVRALAQIPSLDVVVVTSEPGAFDGMDVSIQVVPTWARGYLGRAVWRELRLAKVARVHSAGVIFVPAPEAPFTKVPLPIVMVVHDVGAITAPALYGRMKWLRFSVDLPRACRKATRIVCVSEATRLELLSAVGVPRLKTFVVGEGAGTRRDESPAPEDLCRETATVLFVGAIFQRGRVNGQKNIETLIAAFGREPLLSLPGARLLIAGPLDRSDRVAFERRLVEQNMTERVVHLGYVSRRDLERLYATATVFAYPSLKEGYGLPVLEAMTRKTPVLASDIPSLREVAADAAAYVADAALPDAWAIALRDLLVDRARLQMLAQLGPGQAAKHDWQEVGDHLHAVIEGALG